MGVLHIILKVGHPKIISTQISEQKILMWFLSHNIPKRNKLAEKISPLKPLNQIKPNLAGMVLGWSPFNIVSDSPALHSKWLLLLKIEISLVVNFHFITNQNELKFELQLYMAMSSLTYILGFSVRFFQPVYSV
jgi:hypothetical protein